MDKIFDEFKEIQIKLKKNLILEDKLNVNNIKYVGGLDISFDKKDPDNACGFITIMDIDTLQVVHKNFELIKLNIPYVSGFLAAREIPVYQSLLSKVKKHNPEYYPHLLLIDGNGILHNIGFGVASHLGVLENIPTIGVAKTLMCIDGLNEKTIKNIFKQNCSNKGDYIDLKGVSGNIYGVAFKSSIIATNPIYISIGHMVSLKTAIGIVGKLCIFKNVEPIRISDIESKIHF